MYFSLTSTLTHSYDLRSPVPRPTVEYHTCKNTPAHTAKPRTTSAETSRAPCRHYAHVPSVSPEAARLVLDEAARHRPRPA